VFDTLRLPILFADPKSRGWKAGLRPTNPPKGWKWSHKKPSYPNGFNAEPLWEHEETGLRVLADAMKPRSVEFSAPRLVRGENGAQLRDQADADEAERRALALVGELVNSPSFGYPIRVDLVRHFPVRPSLLWWHLARSRHPRLRRGKDAEGRPRLSVDPVKGLLWRGSRDKSLSVYDKGQSVHGAAGDVARGEWRFRGVAVRETLGDDPLNFENARRVSSDLWHGFTNPRVAALVSPSFEESAPSPDLDIRAQDAPPRPVYVPRPARSRGVRALKARIDALGAQRFEARHPRATKPPQTERAFNKQERDTMQTKTAKLSFTKSTDTRKARTTKGAQVKREEAPPPKPVRVDPRPDDGFQLVVGVRDAVLQGIQEARQEYGDTFTRSELLMAGASPAVLVRKRVLVPLRDGIERTPSTPAEIVASVLARNAHEPEKQLRSALLMLSNPAAEEPDAQALLDIGLSARVLGAEVLRQLRPTPAMLAGLLDAATDPAQFIPPRGAVVLEGARPVIESVGESLLRKLLAETPKALNSRTGAKATEKILGLLEQRDEPREGGEAEPALSADLCELLLRLLSAIRPPRSERLYLLVRQYQRQRWPEYGGCIAAADLVEYGL
jgi:hypothetical protein